MVLSIKNQLLFGLLIFSIVITDISIVKNKKSHIDKTHNQRKAINPFIKLMEDKLKVSKAFKENRPLSSLGISFVKPL